MGRETFTYTEKKNLIREIENTSVDKVARKYGLQRNTLYGFLKDKEKIFKACKDGFGEKRKLPRTGEVSSDESDKPGKKKFNANDTIDGSQSTHNEWSEINGNYAHRDIYLATETGIYFDTKVDVCRQLKNEKCIAGENAKDRFTVLVCADRTGDDLRKLVVIGNQKLSTNLPVKYHCNSNSWMTAEIFEKELTEWDVNLRKENRKIVLFTDEKMVHPRRDMTNIKLMCYTDLIPEKNVSFDMVRCMKAYYRRNIMENMKDPSLKLKPEKAIEELSQAWKTVSTDAVTSSFVEAGIIQGKPANAYLKFIESWSDRVSPDFSLLKLYTEFDDHVVTSAEGNADEIEESEDVTVQEAYESAKTLKVYYRAQGSLDEDLRQKVLEIVAKVQEQLRNLVPDVQQNDAANEGEGQPAQQDRSIQPTTERRSTEARQNHGPSRHDQGQDSQAQCSRRRDDQGGSSEQARSRENPSAQPRKRFLMNKQPSSHSNHVDSSTPRPRRPNKEDQRPPHQDARSAGEPSHHQDPLARKRGNEKAGLPQNVPSIPPKFSRALSGTPVTSNQIIIIPIVHKEASAENIHENYWRAENQEACGRAYDSITNITTEVSIERTRPLQTSTPSSDPKQHL